VELVVLRVALVACPPVIVSVSQRPWLSINSAPRVVLVACPPVIVSVSQRPWFSINSARRLAPFMAITA
jgi:hypothetical protein